jgi:hypothetical protein
MPPEHVAGSSGVLQFENGPDGKPVLRRLAQIDFVSDQAGKPVAIQRFIGRRPIFAFGNSDGDKEMLEWTAAGTGPHCAALVHHTDAGQAYAYDRQAAIGRLDKACDEAIGKDWTGVDMQHDWKRVFAFE